MNSRIYYTKPSITDLEVRSANDAAKNGWGDKCYEYIDKFENKFKEFTGAKYAISTSSCTGAIHMGLSAINISPGDEVILADINWIATAAPITYLGAKPIFVDILKDTWCIDPKKIEAAITPNTKAIIAVHLYGNLCDMEAILAIGKKYGIPVIEDAAEAIGSKWQDKHAGTIGKFGTFSFHGTKTLTTGEGGVFITNDADLYTKVLTFSNHGRAKSQVKQFWSDEIGFKYKMSNIQAAIGLGQMERIDELIAEKRRVFKYYFNSLCSLPLKMNPEPSNVVNGFWMPSIVVNKEVDFNKQALLDDLKKNDIDARVFFWPISMLPMFEKKLDNEVSYSISSRAINLPSYYGLKESEMDRIIDIIKKHILKK
jgi:perosamine synthetase